MDQMETSKRWASLVSQPFPYLHELDPIDRDGFVLLDAYLRDCIEEWFATGGQLSARSVVLLDDCARTITKRFKLLDGEGQSYFEQWRRLAKQILRGLDLDQASHQAEQEMFAELGWGIFFDEPLADLFALVETPAGRG